MRIAIVDDDVFFLETLKEDLQNQLRKAGRDVQICAFSRSLHFESEWYKNSDFDLYFLDVEMPGADGLELAGKIRERDREVPIVLITDYDSYAIRGYKYQVFDYILKKDYVKELPSALKRLQEKWEDCEEGGDEHYVIQNGTRYEKFRIRDIIYAEKDKKNVVFYCRDAAHRERITIGEVYDKLPKEEFMYIDRGRIVNLKYVAGMQQQKIELLDGKELPVSRYRMEEVKHRFLQYWKVT